MPISYCALVGIYLLKAITAKLYKFYPRTEALHFLAAAVERRSASYMLIFSSYLPYLKHISMMDIFTAD